MAGMVESVCEWPRTVSTWSAQSQVKTKNPSWRNVLNLSWVIFKTSTQWYEPE